MEKTPEDNMNKQWIVGYETNTTKAIEKW